MFTRECLEVLRDRIDLVDVIGSHVELKKAGASYKGLCPFHDEKSPSFMIQKGDRHYHCFGCGAHGDAIEFLTQHLKLTFSDAVESLADRFKVPLQKLDHVKEEGPGKGELKKALELAHRFFQFNLLHTEEGHIALKYLKGRDIDLEFVETFGLGYAPSLPGLLKRWLNSNKISNETAQAAGLLNTNFNDFFSTRILFPIKDASGSIIGFSGRKYKEETFGGKYINTPETPLFRKSKVLFGLDLSRKRIVKERRALIVEGQLDCLRLISHGFNLTVAGQGTAFGEGHVRELIQLGVQLVTLGLDNDPAGQEAAVKIGSLFQKEGIEVKVVHMPPGEDPDSFLRKNGPEPFKSLLEGAEDYLPFLVRSEARGIDIKNAAGKNAWVQKLTARIKGWDQPLVVHESLRKLAELTQVPEEMVGIGEYRRPQVFMKKASSLQGIEIDYDRVLEGDLLRWLLLEKNPSFIDLAKAQLSPADFKVRICREIYEKFLISASQDILSLSISLEDPEARLFLADLIQKKVNREKAETLFMKTIQEILDRNWLRKREEIKIKIQSNQYSEEEVLQLIKEFDELKKNPPKINV